MRAPCREPAAVPRLLEVGPGRPIGDRPRSRSLPSRSSSRPGRRRSRACPGRSIAGTPISRNASRKSRGIAGRQRHELVRVGQAFDPGTRELFDRRAPRLGHEDAVEAAAPHPLPPPTTRRATGPARALDSSWRSWPRAVPPVELPHVHDLGPPAGRPDRAPHAEAEHVAFLAPDRAPVRRHVVHVAGPVVPDDVDELVDVHLRAHGRGVYAGVVAVFYRVREAASGKGQRPRPAGDRVGDVDTRVAIFA